MDIVHRILDGQVPNELGSEPKLSKDAFAEQAAAADAPVAFATSGAQTPSPFADPAYVEATSGEGLALAGLREDDVLLNLGAPMPHLSGWGARHGAEYIGAEAVNDNFQDYEDVIERGDADRVTAMFAVPKMAAGKGAEIAERHGPPTDVFPNMEKGLFSGDMLRPDQRSQLAGQWEFDMQREFYAASEIGIIAAATDDTRRMVPMLHRYVLEIEDSDGNIVDIREVEEPREGSLLVTDPARTAVDVTRYELGDQVRAWPGELPDIEVLGRNDDTINFSGAHLHPSEIYEAATQAYGDDVRCVPYASTPDDTAVDFYIVGAESDASSAFIDELFDVSGALRQAYHEDGFVEYLDVHHVDSMDETPAEPAPGPKSVHVVFDESYRG